jgi:hypothetical protein
VSKLLHHAPRFIERFRSRSGEFTSPTCSCTPPFVRAALNPGHSPPFLSVGARYIVPAIRIQPTPEVSRSARSCIGFTTTRIVANNDGLKLLQNGLQESAKTIHPRCSVLSGAYPQSPVFVTSVTASFCHSGYTGREITRCMQ